jgi:ribosomal protein S6--L-glutamate ligase
LDKTIIGAEEWLSFPALGVHAVKARVDSGAKISSIHAFNVSEFRREGRLWVSFEVHPLQNNRTTIIRCELPVHDKRRIKSSSGESEQRYVVLAPMQLGDQQWDIELSLSNRDSMEFRMLLGREAMEGRLLVDPSLRYAMGDYTDEQAQNLYGPVERPKSGLKIGVLASNPNLYSNQRLLEAGAERGHEMVFLNLQQCYMKVDDQNPDVHYRGGATLSDLNAVITRIKPSLTFYGCAMARQFDSMGIYTVNSSEAIAQSRDKLKVPRLDFIPTNKAVTSLGVRSIAASSWAL